MKNGNFVAKYNWRVNKAKTFVDRKKASKAGYKKHKNSEDTDIKEFKNGIFRT